MGIPEPTYSPGVRLGDIKSDTVAAQAGLRRGDVVLQVGKLQVPASPASVQVRREGRGQLGAFPRRTRACRAGCVARERLSRVAAVLTPAFALQLQPASRGRPASHVPLLSPPQQIVVDKIRDSPGEQLQILLERDGSRLTLPVTPAPSPKDGTGRIGIQLQANSVVSCQGEGAWWHAASGASWGVCLLCRAVASFLVPHPPSRRPARPRPQWQVTRKVAGNPLEAVQLAAEEVYTLTGTVLKGEARERRTRALLSCWLARMPARLPPFQPAWHVPSHPIIPSHPQPPALPAGLYQFATNFSSTVENVSGPVAILAVGAEVARSNAPGLYQFAALVNINLAVVNILPLPALDGAPPLALRVDACLVGLLQLLLLLRVGSQGCV